MKVKSTLANPDLHPLMIFFDISMFSDQKEMIRCRYRQRPNTFICLDKTTTESERGGSLKELDGQLKDIYVSK